MLQNQLAKGNNGLTKTKYLTFGIEAESAKAAKLRLERIETDIINNFKQLGVAAAPMNGSDRLHVMADIKAGRTNCVIVKDLSRFGRNYLVAGEYIEKIFPFLGVRFIAINDNFDSERERTSSDDLMIPFKNLINEAYCRDISVKIRSQFEIKRKRGEYLASFAAYGYRKSETNHNQLVIDEYAADVVRGIFQSKLQGASPQAIADQLNRDGVLSPMEYKKALGMKYATSFKSNARALWSAASIIRVLKNPIYIGVLTQGRETTPSYKVHKRISRNSDEWTVIPDCHEPIIAKADFDKVQKVLSLDTRTCKDESVVQLFSGMVFCADCGASMIRKTIPAGGRKYVYYVKSPLAQCCLIIPVFMLFVECQ